MTFSFNTGIPATNNNPSVDQPDMQINNVSTDAILAVDHISFNTANGGQHKQITFNQDASYVPVPPVSPPVLFTDIVNALPELKFFSGDAAHSSDQYVVGTTGSVLLFNGIIIKWGTGTASLGGVVNNFVPNNSFPNNCFVVIPVNTAGASRSLRVLVVTTSSFTAFSDNVLASSIRYIAIGN